MYEQAQSQAGAQGAAGDPGQAGAADAQNAGYGDDVVDGDFREV